MFDALTGRWAGICLSLITVIGTLWLAVTGDLDLYVHPRYFVFTIVMAVVGGVLAVAALLFLPGHDEGEEAHDAEVLASSGRVPAFSAVARLLVLATAAIAILVLPPATLSSRIAGNRELNAASTTGAPIETVELAGSDGTSFSVKDWAGLLRQGLPEEFFADKSAQVTGFVLDAGSDDAFYLTRYLITHCAIDAQPVGIPVHWPGWRTELDADAWVSLAGEFRPNTSPAVEEAVALVPVSSERIEEPEDPYVY